ncbi:hypothetical protein [Vibrio coralliirubri]|uniref:hypothetical protein n=1 Tax=Vibrio coralliirubri TaxID=1516159 RepID=UPI000A3C3C85|nr:hypothetical protein [Vibrio coralliirubri]
MFDKDKEILELRAKLSHEASVNKLITERELMHWQGRYEKRKYQWYFPVLVGAGLMAVLQLLINKQRPHFAAY